MDITNPGKIAPYVFILESILAKSRYTKFADVIGLRGDETVLEFGCGWGAGARALAERLPKGKLICFDISTEWIAVTKRRLKIFSNVRFILGDITKLAPEENCADIITIHYVLHDIPQPQRIPVMTALVKWLKPDGRIVLKEPTKKNHGMPAEEIRAIMKQVGLKESKWKEEKGRAEGVFER